MDHICDDNPHDWGEWLAYDELALDMVAPYQYHRECRRMGCIAVEQVELLVPLNQIALVNELIGSADKLVGALVKDDMAMHGNIPNYVRNYLVARDKLP